MEDKEAVEEARAAYEELTERQKEYVENLGYLVAEKRRNFAEMLDELENLQGSTWRRCPNKSWLTINLTPRIMIGLYKEGEDRKPSLIS